MPLEFRIHNKEIGVGKPTFIIAELSANHNQDLDVAIRTIQAMNESGADAVKLQTYTADTITIDCDNEYFQIGHDTLWDGRFLYDLYKEAYTPWEWHAKLKKVSNDLGMEFFSSPFDNSAVDFLEELNVPAYKIASFEITDIPLIEYTASKGKPMIISTGIAELDDIDEAVDACNRMGNNQIALLKCTSAYPAPFEDANLATIPDLARRFNCTVGLSDHTLGISVPIAAVSLGASIIEKHFILDKNIGGPDADFSLNPNEFKSMVKAVRETEQAVGKTSYELTEKVKNNRQFSRSLFAVKDIMKGELFSERNIRSIRPGYGLPPKHFKEIIGRTAQKDVKRGTPLEWSMVNK